MHKITKIAIAICIIIVIAVIAVVFYIKSQEPLILDGPGMEYTWVEYELYSQWINLDDPDAENASELGINDKIVRFTNVYGYSGELNYTLPDDASDLNITEQKVYLSLEENDSIKSIFFIDVLCSENRFIPYIQVVAVDKNGNEQTIRFVRFEDIGLLPEDFTQTLSELD